MEVRLSTVFNRADSRGRCWPLSACPPPHSCIPNAVFTRSVLRCEYQRERALLVNKPSAGGGGERNKDCVWIHIPLLQLFWQQRNIVHIGIDYVNCTQLGVMFYRIECEAVFCICFVTRRTWFSAQTQTHYRSVPRTWTAPWAKPPGPSRRPPKRYSWSLYHPPPKREWLESSVEKPLSRPTFCQ